MPSDRVLTAWRVLEMVWHVHDGWDMGPRRGRGMKWHWPGGNWAQWMEVGIESPLALWSHSSPSPCRPPVHLAFLLLCGRTQLQLYDFQPELSTRMTCLSFFPPKSVPSQLLFLLSIVIIPNWIDSFRNSAHMTLLLKVMSHLPCHFPKEIGNIQHLLSWLASLHIQSSLQPPLESSFLSLREVSLHLF